jgi:long-subunit acyl-CoA synthetase (AMP-forming)
MNQTIIELFKKTVEKYPTHPALHYKEQGRWHAQSWQEYYQEVMSFARGLMHLGLEARDALTIIGANSREWVIADMAAIAAGGVPAGVYPSSSAEQCAYIIEHSRSSLVVVSTPEQLDKVSGLLGKVPSLRAIVLIQGSSALPQVYSWQEVLNLGCNVAPSLLDARITAQKADDLATLVYTSGTTAHPKGVMLSHTNLTWAAGALIKECLHLTHEDVLLSYLPLSHIAEQIISIHAPLHSAYQVYFAESIEHLASNLQEVRPTVFFGVPRVWEKIHSKMLEKGATASPLKRKIAAWAKKVGCAQHLASAAPSLMQRLQYALAKKLVYSKVRAALGLDRCRMQVSAAAPISRSTLEYFFSLDIPLLEVYGLSESSGPATISVPDAFRITAVGRAIAGTKVTLASDGEILIRGPHVCMGYYRNPEETAELIDTAGYLHSGDLGKIDADGYLTISGRKKNLIITAGGENISTEMIESKFKGIAGIEHVVAVGDRKKYLSLLFTLDPQQSPSLAKSLGSKSCEIDELARCPELNAYLKSEIERINQNIAHVQTIKKFKVLPHNFAEATGELTPTMKVKRNIVLQKFQHEIAEMYS